MFAFQSKCPCGAVSVRADERDRMEAGIQKKNVLFRYAKFVSCIPVPKWKSVIMLVRRSLWSPRRVDSKGHGVESLGHLTNTASAGSQQRCGCR